MTKQNNRICGECMWYVALFEEIEEEEDTSKRCIGQKQKPPKINTYLIGEFCRKKSWCLTTGEGKISYNCNSCPDFIERILNNENESNG